ncbi:MAG: tetratricopeptide repeat protein [Bacteroidales bacterium]
MSKCRNSHIWILLLFTTGSFLNSCSVEKNTAATRNWHNLTSHYNIFFNARESFKDGLIRAEESIEDDYTSILPLFYYEDESIQQSITPQMNRAIDKSTKVITFHSITAKPDVKKGKQTEKDKEFYEKTEYNKWVDDCYILIGKSYMYQGEFFMAAESFNHVLKNFPNEETYYQAMAWLVRAYNVIGVLDKAEELVVVLKDVDEFPKEYKEELYTSLADYHMRKKEYEKAADNLEKALDTRPKKNRRIRYRYILAQLQKEAGNGEASIKNFKKVVRMNPPYVMSFNAKVSMAEAFREGASNSDEIIKLLNRMLRDSKNDEFRDQIYYALGNIYLEKGERERAIEYYHLSVSASVQNNYQKGQSSLTLADIYYNEPRYNMSAAYYDTAVNLLSDDYPNYSTLKRRSESLNDLVRNLNTFELQDSVQMLAGMTEAERFAVIDDIIEKIRKEEQEARMREQEAMQDLQFGRTGLMDGQTGFGGGTQQGGGKWYFYNLNAKSFGQPEFRMKWGNRKLEDNWRRSNKQSTTELIEEVDAEGSAVENGDETVVIDNKSREFYLRDIPLTDSAMDVSHLKLEEALYNMARVYRDDLLDYEMAIESLEELVSRYPDGNYAISSYYYLHNLYNNIQQPTRANFYKDLLSRKYPDSHLTKLLTNPAYILELEEEEKKIERYYEDVYNAYIKERFSEVIRKADQGLKQYTEKRDMMARLSYLRAMSVGALKGKEAMKTELDSILAWYPGTDIAAEAQDIIDYLYVAFPVIKEADQVKEAVQLYTYNPDSDHRFLLAVKKQENLNLINFNLLNFNLDYFNTYDLNIVMEQRHTDYNILTVTGFNGYEGVERYAEHVRENVVEVMGEIPSESYEILLISADNYEKLLGVNEFVPYLLFYRQNYQK